MRVRRSGDSTRSTRRGHSGLGSLRTTPPTAFQPRGTSMVNACSYGSVKVVQETLVSPCAGVPADAARGSAAPLLDVGTVALRSPRPLAESSVAASWLRAKDRPFQRITVKVIRSPARWLVRYVVRSVAEEINRESASTIRSCSCRPACAAALSGVMCVTSAPCHCGCGLVTPTPSTPFPVADAPSAAAAKGSPAASAIRPLRNRSLRDMLGCPPLLGLSIGSEESNGETMGRGTHRTNYANILT